MQRLMLTLVVATVFVSGGLVAWKAEAMVGAGGVQVSTAAKATSPVDRAACGGRGEHCPPGYNWNGNRCVPC
jgi:hypothetical protein